MIKTTILAHSVLLNDVAFVMHNVSSAPSKECNILYVDAFHKAVDV